MFIEFDDLNLESLKDSGQYQRSQLYCLFAGEKNPALQCAWLDF